MDNTKRERAISDHGWGLALLLAVYISAGFVLSIYYRYEGLQSDAIAYLGIAQKYADGNLTDAVNGFWSPLFSWLLALCIKAGYPLLHSARMLNLAAGGILLVGLRGLFGRFGIYGSMRDLFLAASAIIVLSYSTPVFPDLILLCILVWYLYFIFDRKYHLSRYSGVICGLLGALGYFSKNYAFPFFISHFLFINVFYYLRAVSSVEKRRILMRAVIGIISFSLISGIWISMISIKYDHLAIGTAGSYNFSQINPDLPAMSEQPEPVLYKGLMAPPNSTAVSIMEDPTYIDVDSWKILDSSRNMVYFIKHVLSNIAAMARIFEGFSLFSIPIILAAFLTIKRQKFKDLGLLLPLATLTLYSAGYTPFIIDQNNIRYLWIDNILILLMGGQLLNIWFKHNKANNISLKNILVIVLLLSFSLSPVMDIFEKSDRGERLFDIYKRISSEKSIHGNVASNSRWGDSLQLSFYLNNDAPTHYLGIPEKGSSAEKQLEELNAFEVDYFIVWGESAITLENKDITGGRISNLRVFSLKKSIE